MSDRMRKLRLNSTFALLYQGLLVISGLVLPRCYLAFYGSEVNGLISSITQFLSFINICDMGISAVISSALYKPLAEQNYDKISRVFLYSKKFFRFISYILLGYILVLLFVYPQLVAEQFSVTYTILLIICMSISNFSQYFLGISYQLLLNADQRSYVQLIINGGTLIANTILSVAIMALGGGIHVVKLVASLIYLLRPVLMMIYVKKHYRIDETVKADANAVPQKASGIIQHISYIICENTDVAVLTIFSTLANVSIYSVYFLVLGSIKTLINAATTGVQAMFGNMIANEEKEKLHSTYHFYEWLMHCGTVLLFVVAGKLIVPFVLLYTKNVNDANYNVPLFAILITIAYAIYTLRNAMYVLIRSAGHYKQTQAASLLEAVLNLGISMILVFRFGLIGVAVGTMTAELFYGIYLAWYLSKNIVNQPQKVVLMRVIVDSIAVAGMILSVSWIDAKASNFLEWIGTAVLVTAICSGVLLVVQSLFSWKNVKRCLSFLTKKKEIEENDIQPNQEAILSLLQSSLLGKSAEIPDGVDWDQVIELSHKAQIVTIIYDAICKNQCQVSPEQKARMRDLTLKRILRDEMQEEQISRLTDAFGEHKIDYAFLKGASIKHLYPNSSFRSMGDIDVLIRVEQYDKIKEILTEMGYSEWRETDHELIWIKPPFICLELHKRIVPSGNKVFYAYYGNGWSKMKPLQGTRYAMSPEDEFIYLLMHFSKHYRDGGIGIRHLVDLWIYMEAHKEMNQEYIIEELNKLRLDQFFHNILQTANVWFFGGEQTTATKIIADTVFQSGSYGNKDKSDYAYAVKVEGKYGSPFVAKVVSAWKLVFMPPALLKIKYPVLKQKPYLMPAYAVRRWWDAIFYKRNNIKSQAKRWHRINKKNIRQYQNELDSVGLDYLDKDEL